MCMFVYAYIYTYNRHISYIYIYDTYDTYIHIHTLTHNIQISIYTCIVCECGVFVFRGDLFSQEKCSGGAERVGVAVGWGGSVCVCVSRHNQFCFER